MIAAMMVAALTASAQDDNLKNEIGIYYGFGSASDIVSTVATAMSTPFSSSDQTVSGDLSVLNITTTLHHVWV